MDTERSPRPLSSPSGRPTLAGAIAYALDYLGSVLAEAVPDDPGQPIGAPQASMSVAVADLEPLLLRIGARHPGKWLTVRFDATGCRIDLREQGNVRHMATAADLTGALVALGLVAT
ncbi:hypothetical protein I0C86_19515 [Plantactinospora sp. S1510]|uniref:Uncharacterized protein n=1 Tax=Plantactinospora alkalitolerans TaxID=2789879 RepID=A0ABS0GYH5_9ACTN|nr:hypothetical protein [Plantactinospora alkalitolerans]MBF9131131.1 hypothetical protein [Plantactinospora alkalitolerans]